MEIDREVRLQSPENSVYLCLPPSLYGFTSVQKLTASQAPGSEPVSNTYAVNTAWLTLSLLQFTVTTQNDQFLLHRGGLRTVTLTQCLSNGVKRLVALDSSFFRWLRTMKGRARSLYHFRSTLNLERTYLPKFPLYCTEVNGHSIIQTEKKVIK